MRLLTFFLCLGVTVSSALFAQNLTISTSGLPYGGLQQNYFGQLTATGGTGNYNWAIASGLPTGLTLNSQTGVISGTPSAAGTFNFLVRVTDTQTGQTTTKTLAIGVMQISTATPLAGASLSAFYSTTFATSDGPPTGNSWTTPASGLPPGLTLATNGTLSGTPTQAGTYNFQVTVTAPNCNPCIGSAGSPTITATKTFALTVTGRSAGFTIDTASPLPNTEAGLPYSQTITASGGLPPYSFFAQPDPFTPSGLPPGINLSQSGVLSGTATSGGTFTFTVFAQDANTSKTQKQFSLTVASSLSITTPSPLPDGTRGTPYSQTITATGGTTPYTFTITNPPAGLSLDANGNLTGTPQVAGTYNFTVTVSDKMGGSVSKAYQVFIADIPTPGSLPVKTSPTSLNFIAAFLGNSPPPQFIDVTPIGNQPTGYKVQVDSGPNTATPVWISVQPLGGIAPAQLRVNVDNGTMSPGTYTARILVIDNTPTFTTVTVTLVIAVADPAPKLDITPTFLRFTARVAAPGTQDQVLAVRNPGGGQPFSFTATTLPGDANFISSVTPNTASLLRNSPVPVDVKINTSGLGVGSYREVIRFTTQFGTTDVPVSLFVAADGPILGVNVTGLRFQARQNFGYSNAETVKVLNVGNPATTLTWTADLVTGSDLFTFSVSGNTASSNNPGTISVLPTAAALQKAPKGYFGLLRITSPSLNSPQYVVLLLDIADPKTAPLPDLSPTGFLFIVPAGGQSGGQILAVHTPSADAVPFEVAVTTSDGGSWLTATPTSGVASATSPGQVTLSAKFVSIQTPGILTAGVSISEAGILRTATVTAIVLPGPSTGAATDTTPAASCTPSKLALTTTGLVNNFGVPAKWPETLIVQLNDDCGNPAINGSVSANFSNGDAPLALKSDGQAGIYSASWQPVQDTSQMVVTLQGSAGSLPPATLQLMGAINPNDSPILSVNGTVSPFNRIGGGALAPGTLVEVYGSGLASSTVSPNMLPLPPVFNGSYVTVGPYQAPFTFLSAGQVNVQLPFELVPTQQYPILVSANNAFTMPDTLDIVPLKPSVAGFADTHIIAQHNTDFSLVDAAHPAKPGEFVIMYVLGMGPTAPAVATGQPAPSSPPLATAITQPSVTVGGKPSNVVFAGLTPGLSGLYQIDFQIPTGLPTGDVDVVVSQNGVFANTTKLPVSQ
jgi:uncharacterized protein (TIGR03437 family)